MYKSMSTENKHLKGRIMRRVYIVSFLRQFLSPFLFRGVVLFMFITLGNVLVSVPNVISNISIFTNVNSVIFFLLDAFLHTEFLVQMVLVSSVVLTVWLFKDFLRIVSFLNHNGRLA